MSNIDSFSTGDSVAVVEGEEVVVEGRVVGVDEERVEIREGESSVVVYTPSEPSLVRERAGVTAPIQIEDWARLVVNE